MCKALIKALSDKHASVRQQWRERSAYFHDEDTRYLKFLVPAGGRVLELGCGTGATLAALHPAYGVGVDFSAAMVAVARTQCPQHTFVAADIEASTWTATLDGPFDYIIIVDTIGSLDDCQATFTQLHACADRTRV